ncbi:MAG: carotenoid oxygenase family protein [Acidimicrobiales bacterium]|nr:carotenoid oxygenase family protein [Acidimicrobiales bacterium]
MPNPYLHGNFAPVHDERSDDHELPVTGVIPPDLNGRLLRNGPNPAVAPVDEDDYHWFSGDGMIHSISLADGKATGYRNRWVRTRALAAKLETAAPKGPSEPLDGPANTHVIRHGGTTLALVESGFPHAVSPDLSRARVHDFDGGLASPMTAHPKVDPATGELIFFGSDVFGPPFLRYHVVDADGRLVRTEDIDIPRATMIHDFGVTSTRAVFLDLPVVFDLQLASQGRTLPYRWLPEAGARVGVMPRSGGNADLHWIGIDPVYAFHVLNCYDDADAVVLDVIRYDRAFDTGPGEAITSVVPALARWTVNLATNRVSEQQLDDTAVEFPRIDPAVAGLPHRYGYCTRVGDRADQPAQHGLVKYDLHRDESTRYEPGDARASGEPVFVRAADGSGEDEGWVLTIVYDATRDASDLVILDATSFAGPPVATVHLPARVPFGFHGSWVPTDS